jgi:hypothetical protein
MDKERTCNACKITKPLSEFHKRVNDFTKRCKECINEAGRLRYKLKSLEEGKYQCCDLDLDELHDELSLPELRTLMHQHDIPIRAHCTKQELVDTLKQHGILPEDYVSGLRRAATAPIKTCKRLNAKIVELTDMSNGSVINSHHCTRQQDSWEHTIIIQQSIMEYHILLLMIRHI